MPATKSSSEPSLIGTLSGVPIYADSHLRTAYQWVPPMPASKHTKKATTPKLKRQWEHVRSSAESRGASPGSAIRQANSVVKKSKKGQK